MKEEEGPPLGSTQDEQGSAHVDEPPPILKTWARVYRFILVYLAGVLLILAWISRAYTY